MLGDIKINGYEIPMSTLIEGFSTYFVPLLIPLLIVLLMWRQKPKLDSLDKLSAETVDSIPELSPKDTGSCKVRSRKGGELEQLWWGAPLVSA